MAGAGGISIPLITGSILQFYSACALVYMIGPIAIDLHRTH
jgi:MFS transporter, ACS family, D-galactonate transporter